MFTWRANPSLSHPGYSFLPESLLVMTGGRMGGGGSRGAGGAVGVWGVGRSPRGAGWERRVGGGLRGS
jgi:hypothetical protein